MENLFKRNVAAETINRLEKLNPNSKPLWGKMNVSQMLEHCEAPLKVALGELQLRQTFLGLLFGRMAKKQLLKPEPFKKNLPTVSEFVVKDTPDFMYEKQKLRSLIENFSTSNAETIVARKHPFFGKMTREEWGVLQWKHLDHHFRQFGV